MDLERFRLRTFLESLPREELQRIDEPIALADVAAVHDGNPKAVWFRQAAGAELAANVTASRSRLALAFGTTPANLLAEVRARLARAQKIVEVQSAPAQEVVEPQPDLTALPVHLQHAFDGAPYISASMDFTRDGERTNVGIRRLMLRGRREAGVDLNAPSDLRAIYQAAVGRGERVPIAFVVGSHPVDHVAAAMRLPGDELNLMAALRGTELPVVKCLTSELRVPADAEYVLEGYLDERGYAEPEGPYGEFLGYYGALKTNPVFHLTAITRRRDAVFQTATISGATLARTDTAQLNAIRAEVAVWRAVEAAVSEVVAVHATPSGGGAFNMRVALRQRSPGEARAAIDAVFACPVHVKHVFVVDADVDVFSAEAIDWALATRFQAARDLVVRDGFRPMPLDPSLRGRTVASKAGFDLTLPVGESKGIDARMPEPPRYEGRRFDSVAAALADGPKFFVELMIARGSRDGREIVRELDAIRASGTLERDPEVQLGMIDTKDLVKRTERCLTCHLGTAEKSVDHEMIAAGHPDLVFDLEAFSAAMPRHWRAPVEGDPFAPVRSFSVGQLVHVRSGLERLARRARGPVWPEYAELDCFSCHHSLTRPEDSWRQAQGYENRRPGNPPLNQARWTTGRRVLEAFDPQAEHELDAVMTKIAFEASKLRIDPSQLNTLVDNARTLLDRGIARALSVRPDAAVALPLFHVIAADAEGIASHGERAAEQAGMAMETLYLASLEGKPESAAVRSAFDELFQQFQSPSSYDPRRFVAQIRKIESTLR